MQFSEKGDGGYTSLVGGQRILKSEQRVETYGTLDEASSALGMAKALAARPKTGEMIVSIQKGLFLLGVELATASEDAGIPLPDYGRTGRARGGLDRGAAEGCGSRKRVYPAGGTMASAAIDLVRTMIRRAERNAVRLREEKIISDVEVLRFLNRMADLLFTLARYEEASA
jgi:cob(I)alamin adenosyltransferase